MISRTRGSAPLAVALIALLSAVLVSGAGPAAGEVSNTEFSLNPGQAVFWNGEHIAQAHVPDPALCGIAAHCPEYRIHIDKDGASRLRVALHVMLADPDDVRFWPDSALFASEMIFNVRVEDAAGNVLATGSTEALLTVYAVEVFVNAPAQGVYTVRVIPTSVTDMAFRMRAKLEKHAPHAPQDTTALLSPNLRVIPPFEFNFYRPTVGFGPGGGTPDPENSCMVEETEEAIGAGFAAPEVCLRYSMGFENAGDGRWDITNTCALDPADPLSCDLYQRRWSSDGVPQPEDEWNPAGKATWHTAHAHFHYQGAYDFQLFRVEGGRVQEPALGPGRKLGVNPGNERMAEWRRFWPACGPPPTGGTYPTSCQHDRDFPADAFFRLQAGWGDLYEWNRSGNYVAFPRDGDGRPQPGVYVLRGTTDSQEVIIESDETDNISYALIEVFADGRVDLIERGYGSDPWDPSKEVVTVTP